MREYCVTFVKNEGENSTEVYHCHVAAPLDSLALQEAFRNALETNVSLRGTTDVVLKVIVDVPADALEGYEVLRSMHHGSAMPVQPTSSHVH